MSREPILQTARLQLVVATPADATQLLSYQQTNREHLSPWEPLRESTYFSLEATSNRLKQMQQDAFIGAAVHLLLRDHLSDALLGTCSFTNIIRGPFQACHLGFGLARSAQGQGLMREALSAALPFMFQHHDLHRVMANYLPGNTRSAKLLAALGFEIEGLAREYLMIDGIWQDHVLTALIGPTR